MNENCAYCMEGELVNAFGIKIGELESSKVYLFREQSHPEHKTLTDTEYEEMVRKYQEELGI